MCCAPRVVVLEYAFGVIMLDRRKQILKQQGRDLRELTWAVELAQRKLAVARWRGGIREQDLSVDASELLPAGVEAGVLSSCRRIRTHLAEAAE